MKTNELTGAALDWAVAKCEGLPVEKNNGGSVSFDAGLYPTFSDLEKGRWQIWHPSTNWAQGGPIIEREQISVEFGRAEFKTDWIAYKLGLPHEDNPEGGPTPLIAAMRCYVASKLGDEVAVPEELQ